MLNINIFIMCRRILVFIILLLTIVNLKAQVNTYSILGVSCINDTAQINLNANITYPTTVGWYYKVNNIWVNINTLSFAYTNTSEDTLFTTECGKYKIQFYYDPPSGGAPVLSVDSFTVSCPLTIGQGLSPILCYGDSSGILKRPAFGGVKFDPNKSMSNFGIVDGDEYYQYVWYYSTDSIASNPILLPDTSENLVNAYAGWYKTIVIDSVGCSDTIGFVEFKNPQELKIDTLIISNISCIADSTGSIFLKVRGGKKYSFSNKYHYYLLLNSDTIAFSDTTGSSINFTHISSSNNIQSFYPDSVLFSDLASGLYDLVIIDSNDCVRHQSVLVEEPDPYTAYTSTLTPLLCESDTVDFIIDSITGGNSQIDYYFIGFGNDSITVTAGTYMIFVKDLQFGCADTLIVNCNAQYQITIETSVESAICFESATGSINIDTIYGATPPYNIQWGGINPQSVSSGYYYVMITDSNGCFSNNEVWVGENPQLIANPIFYSPSCYGSSDGSIVINPEGGVGILNYFWLNGTGTADSLFGLPADTYTLVVSDSLSCTDSISLILNQPNPLDFTFSNYLDTLPCVGSSTTVDLVITGGTGPYLINWNDGSSNLQRILSAGNYSCQIIDAEGCEITKFLDIYEPINLSITLDVSSTCEGGVATVASVGGTQPISYFWSTGDTSTSVNNLTDSLYWVIAIDSCGNTDSITFNIVAYQLETEILFDSSYFYHVEIINTTSNGPFSYEWQDVLGNILSISEQSGYLCEGNYYVTVSDNNNDCSITDTITVDFNLLNGLIDLSATSVLPDSNLWGSGPYTYLWDNGDITVSSDICPGDHWVEVTDRYDCTIREDFIIDPIIIDIDPADLVIECSLENLDVIVTATASGGTPPYSYQWSNGVSGNTLDLSLNPGGYSILITDNNNCLQDTSLNIGILTSECVPNIFTPNGDGKNDSWSLENTFLYGDSEIKIYGRYGSLIYHSIGYEKEWDGTNDKGVNVPDGAYFYSINIGNNFKPIKGIVTIIR